MVKLLTIGCVVLYGNKFGRIFGRRFKNETYCYCNYDRADDVGMILE